MSATSRQERLELILRLKDNAACDAAFEEIQSLRDVFFGNLARTAYQTGQLDQRDLDYKRGFFRGALWAMRALPQKAHLDLQREIEKAMAEEEGDS